MELQTLQNRLSGLAGGGILKSLSMQRRSFSIQQTYLYACAVFKLCVVDAEQSLKVSILAEEGRMRRKHIWCRSVCGVTEVRFCPALLHIPDATNAVL